MLTAHVSRLVILYLVTLTGQVIRYMTSFIDYPGSCVYYGLLLYHGSAVSS